MWHLSDVSVTFAIFVLFPETKMETVTVMSLKPHINARTALNIHLNDLQYMGNNLSKIENNF